MSARNWGGKRVGAGRPITCSCRKCRVCKQRIIQRRWLGRDISDQELENRLMKKFQKEGWG